MNKKFALGMAVYALVFLLLTAGGLWVFWQYLDAYELSRPGTCVDGYLDELDSEEFRTGAAALLASLDDNLQSEDQSFAVIEAALTEPVTAAKSAKSTSERMVYVLRSGQIKIGTLAIVPGEAMDFGFVPWKVESSEFDFSWLLSPEISITVPSDFTVSLGNATLDESYITASDIPYPALEEFHGEFEMPTMVTYTAGNFLGDLEFTVTNPDGAPVYLTAETDMDLFLPQPSEENYARAESLTRDFLRRYIVFCSNANAEQEDNFGWLNQLLIPGSGLSYRLVTAIDGLQYAQSISDKIQNIDFNAIYEIHEGRYLVDISYRLLTYGQKGPVETDHNMKLVLLQTNYGLKVAAMTRY